MKRDHWMPFYVADYLGDTGHLNTEQHGAYILLLIACWKGGGALPNDDLQLKNITKLSLHKWKNYAEVLRKFFWVENNQLLHKRVLQEVQKANDISEKRKSAGRLGGRPMETKLKPNEKHIETHARGISPSQLLPPSGVSNQRNHLNGSANLAREAAADFYNGEFD